MRTVALAALLLPAASLADDWHVNAELVTDVPIMVGGHLVVETPSRLRIGNSLGVMPGAYVDLINDTATSFEWYGDATAAIIEAVVEDALVWRSHLGWRPFAERGFYVETGYTFVGLSGGTVDESLLVEATGEKPPSRPSGGSKFEFEAEAAMHMIDVELGWQWNVWEAVWLRTALGGAFTLSSSAKVERQFDAPAAAAWDAFEDESEAYLVDTFESYGHTAVFSVAAGWRFH